MQNCRFLPANLPVAPPVCQSVCQAEKIAPALRLIITCHTLQAVGFMILVAGTIVYQRGEQEGVRLEIEEALVVQVACAKEDRLSCSQFKACSPACKFAQYIKGSGLTCYNQHCTRTRTWCGCQAAFSTNDYIRVSVTLSVFQVKSALAMIMATF